MKRLTVIRHAKALDRIDYAEQFPSKSDWDRRCTRKGLLEAIRRARKWQKSSEFFPQILFSSELRRAQETAEIFGLCLNLDVSTVEELNPGNSLSNLHDRILSHPFSHTALVGHEPQLSDYIENYCDNPPIDLINPMAKSGILCFELNQSDADWIYTGSF